jgi:hypothetical protein
MIKDLNEEMMQTLNDVEGVFIVDLYIQSLYLPNSVKDALIDDMPGLYLPGVLKPIIPANQINNITVTDSSNLNNYLTTSIAELKRIAVENKDYFRNKTIRYEAGGMEGSFFLQIYRSLSDKPGKSIVQMQFIKDLMLDFLYQRCRHNVHSFQKYYKYVKQSHIEIIESGNFGDDLRFIIDDLNKFISRHVNHLYFHKELGTNLIIEKSVDYRVYEYYKLLEKLNITD